MGTRKLSHRASKPMVQESNGRTGGLSRRDFLKAAGTVAGGTALFLVDACSPISSLVEPTASIMPSKTLEATGTPTRNPTSTATQTEIPTRAATWTPVPPPKELPPPAKTITIPSILDVNGSISFEITGWYDRAKEKGEKKIRDFDGEIVLEKDPKVLENFRAKGYDGKLLRHTLNESTRGQEREGKIRNYFAKRGFIHAKEYITITFPFMISGLLPMGRNWGYINLASYWSYAPPKLYDKWIRLPDPNISKNSKFTLGLPPSGEIESDLEAAQDTPYLVTIILESNGLSHLLVDNNHLVSHIDRSWNDDFVDLAFLHGGMYLRDCGPGTLWNGDLTIFYS